MTNDLRYLGWITKAAQFSGRDAKCGTDFNMFGRNNSTNKSNNHRQGLDHHFKRMISIQLDTMLRKASEARVDTRLRRRYYLIVLLLPNIFTLACLLLSSI